MHPKSKRINLTGLIRRGNTLNFNSPNSRTKNTQSCELLSSVHLTSEPSLKSSTYLEQIVEDKTTTIEKRQLTIPDGLLSKAEKFMSKCQRCIKKNADINCQFCNSTIYCADCDSQVHLIGKFSLHSRSKIQMKDERLPNEYAYLLQQKQPECTETNQKMVIKIHESIELEKIKTTKNALASCNITQVWRQITCNLQKQFDAIIENLQMKKSEIISKVESKRQKQIQKYEQIAKMLGDRQQSSSNHTNIGSMKKSTSAIDQLEVKLNQFEKHYRIDEKSNENRYSVAMNPFEELKNAINKISFKNLIFKNMFESDLINKGKVRTGSNMSSNLSPMIRTPNRNNRKLFLSNSTFEEVEDHKINEQDNQSALNNYNKSRKERQLNKVRSQKLFMNDYGKKNTAIGKITQYFKTGSKKNLTKK